MNDRPRPHTGGGPFWVSYPSCTRGVQRIGKRASRRTDAGRPCPRRSSSSSSFPPATEPGPTEIGAREQDASDQHDGDDGNEVGHAAGTRCGWRHHAPRIAGPQRTICCSQPNPLPSARPPAWDEQTGKPIRRLRAAGPARSGRVGSACRRVPGPAGPITSIETIRGRGVSIRSLLDQPASPRAASSCAIAVQASSVVPPETSTSSPSGPSDGHVLPVPPRVPRTPSRWAGSRSRPARPRPHGHSWLEDAPGAQGCPGDTRGCPRSWVGVWRRPLTAGLIGGHGHGHESTLRARPGRRQPRPARWSAYTCPVPSTCAPCGVSPWPWQG
jgi:hypothetical protein